MHISYLLSLIHLLCPKTTGRKRKNKTAPGFNLPQNVITFRTISTTTLSKLSKQSNSFLQSTQNLSSCSWISYVIMLSLIPQIIKEYY